MKNQAEIYKALLEGKKIAHDNFEYSKVYIKIDIEGFIVDNHGLRATDCYGFKFPERWHIYEPKQYTFIEAVELMNQGKKMVCERYDRDYIKIDVDYMRLNSGEAYIPTYLEMTERKWTVYENMSAEVEDNPFNKL